MWHRSHLGAITISRFPILKAYAEKFGPMSLLQFDAHTDTWADDDMSRVDHGTMFYKAVKSGTGGSRSARFRWGSGPPMRTRWGSISSTRVRFMRQVRRRLPHKIRGIVGDNPVYLSFDIDGLDPAFAPGTGTPVWGGLSSIQAQIILRDIAGINIKGGDVVEVSPPYRHVRRDRNRRRPCGDADHLPAGVEQAGKNITVWTRINHWLAILPICVG